MNNGKPTSSLFTGGNIGKPGGATTYINNDLRQHKKQTNTEDRNSPHRAGATQNRGTETQTDRQVSKKTFKFYKWTAY